MRHTYLLLAIALVFVSACQSGKRADKIQTIKISDTQVDCIDLSAVFDIRQIVNIDTSVCRLGSIVKIKCNGDDIYVWDNQGIHRFSGDGNLVCNIGNKGRGHNEYLAIGDFDVSGSTVAVLDMYKKVLLFDTDGNYKSSNDLDFYAVGCLLTADRLVLTSGYQEITEKFHVLRLSDLTEESAFGECRENELTYRHFMQQQYFYRDGQGRILYHELMNNTVSLLTDDEFKPLYEFDLYGKTPPADFWNQRFENVMDVVTKLTDRGYCYGLPLYSVDGNRHLFAFNDNGEMKLALADTKQKTSSISSVVCYDNVFMASQYSSIQINLNSSSDISICVPSDKYCDTPSGDNPIIIRLSFRER